MRAVKTRPEIEQWAKPVCQLGGLHETRICFSGQGSGIVGMGRALAEVGEARAVFGPSMTRLIKNCPTYVGRAGKRADAHRKRNLLMAVSMAVVRFCRKWREIV